MIDGFVKKNNVVINTNRDSYLEFQQQKERTKRLANIESSILNMKKDLEELKKIISDKF